MEWHKILAKKGWVAPHWPKEVGGPGWDATRRFIFSEELELAGTPGLSPFGLAMVGPLIIQFGNDQQKERFLPKILSGEEVWCQGYSEPNAGSDLASLQLRAEDKGDHFLLNGQKTWTTYAQYADWIFVLARTNPDVKKQSGISFILCDMKAPGVTVKPFLTTGGTPAFCETWFENVEVPKDNLVGELNMGWTYAKALLGHERTLVAGVGISGRAILRMKRIAAETIVDGKPLLEHTGFRAKVARLEMKLEALAHGELPHPRQRAARSRTGPGVEHPQAPRHRDPAGRRGPDHGGDGAQLAGLVQRARRRAAARAVGRLGLQLPARGDHLRRVERDPAQRHRQVHPRLAEQVTEAREVGQWNSIFPTTRRCWWTRCRPS